MFKKNLILLFSILTTLSVSSFATQDDRISENNPLNVRLINNSDYIEGSIFFHSASSLRWGALEDSPEERKANSIQNIKYTSIPKVYNSVNFNFIGPANHIRIGFYHEGTIYIENIFKDDSSQKISLMLSDGSFWKNFSILSDILVVELLTGEEKEGVFGGFFIDPTIKLSSEKRHLTLK